MTHSITERVLDLIEMEDSATLSLADREISMKHNTTEGAPQTTLTEGLWPTCFNVEVTVQAQVGKV